MHEKILVYTFRTFPFIDVLHSLFPHVYVIHKLKEDLNLFTRLMEEKKPSHVLGMAKSNSRHSFIEPLTINNFNKSKKVIHHENMKYELYVPAGLDSNFTLAKSPSHSFCNYSMYFIADFIFQNNLNLKFSFSHVQKDHIINLKEVFLLS